MTDRAAGQRQDHAGQRIQADQQSGVAEVEAKLGAQYRRDRGNGLELIRQTHPRKEQDCEDQPTALHQVSSAARRYDFGRLADARASGKLAGQSSLSCFSYLFNYQ